MDDELGTFSSDSILSHRLLFQIPELLVKVVLVVDENVLLW
jgi:hypothetical protein